MGHRRAALRGWGLARGTGRRSGRRGGRGARGGRGVALRQRRVPLAWERDSEVEWRARGLRGQCPPRDGEVAPGPSAPAPHTGGLPGSGSLTCVSGGLLLQQSPQDPPLQGTQLPKPTQLLGQFRVGQRQVHPEVRGQGVGKKRDVVLLPQPEKRTRSALHLQHLPQLQDSSLPLGSTSSGGASLCFQRRSPHWSPGSPPRARMWNRKIPRGP